MKNKVNWKLLIICLIIVYAVALLGSLTNIGNDEWYQTIRPSITPPSWVFPIVWNILFFMIALSLYFAWKSSKTNKDKLNVGIIFGINLFLNALWSAGFFGLRNPVLAFVDIILLWISIAIMIKITVKINTISAWLLVPYFLWVSFATVLNYLIVF